MFAPGLLKGNCGSSEDFARVFAIGTVYMWGNIQQVGHYIMTAFTSGFWLAEVKAYFRVTSSLLDN